MRDRAGHAVILGAGLAGGACAWALARRGWRVTLLEREERPGQHASGRNAGLVRRVEADAAISALARAGAALLARPPRDLAGRALYRRTGGVLLGRTEELERDFAAARAAGVECSLGPAAAQPACALLGGAGLALSVPEDGVADPHEVLSAYLAAARAAGAVLRVEAPGALWVEAGEVVGVHAPDGDLRADVVIDAAGPWAADLAREAGALDLELQSYRRHLFWTGPWAPAGLDRDAPWVWDTARGFYLRPESSGWLLCACDHEPRPPEDAVAAADAHEKLAAKVAAVAPGLGEVPIARAWAGLRSFSPDLGFVIGPDPLRRGLFWATGLGGHGLTTSGAVGLLVAEMLSGADDGGPAACDESSFDAGSFDPGSFDPASFDPASFDPGRFLRVQSGDPT
ncbi:MAG: NAD(P)/FAD-dependent oxidoreductase [Planctomycetota bacterium]